MKTLGDNVFVKRREKRPRGDGAEKKFFKRIGGKATPASGAMPGVKGDGHDKEGRFKIECKSTEKYRMGVQYEWLRKIVKEATRVGMLPALSVLFVTASGEVRQGGSWVMIPERVFKRLIEETEGNEGIGL